MVSILVFKFVVAALAGTQMTETVHHGNIFKPLRDYAKKWWDEGKQPLAWLGELISCPFCFSHWACGLTVCWAFVFPVDSLLQLPVLALAAVRCAQLLNDVTHKYHRGPSEKDSEEVFDSESAIDIIDSD